MSTLNVNEIFYSIQGEGIHTGLPSIFVRLQGCNLKPGCYWCDTPYAKLKRGEGVELSIDEIIRGIDYWYHTTLTKTRPRICITGGEPLVQIDSLEELARVLDTSYSVDIETNGTIAPPNWLHLVESWSVDIKTPSSRIGLDPKISELWILSLVEGDQIKFVVEDEIDLNFVREKLLEIQSVKIEKKPTVLISPVVNRQINPNWVKEVVDFCKEYNCRLSLQTHKMIWGSEIRGV